MAKIISSLLHLLLLVRPIKAHLSLLQQFETVTYNYFGVYFPNLLNVSKIFHMNVNITILTMFFVQLCQLNLKLKTLKLNNAKLSNNFKN